MLLEHGLTDEVFPIADPRKHVSQISSRLPRIQREDLEYEGTDTQSRANGMDMLPGSP